MSERQIAFARALPILILTVLCGVVIVVLALRTMSGINRSEAVVQRFAALGRVCEGQPFTAAPPYDPQQTPSLTAVFRQSGEGWLPDPRALPANWQAQDPAAAELVLCLGAAQPLTTVSCQPDDDGALPTRVYGEAISARLLAASSGELVAEDRLESVPEPDCVDRTDETPATNVSTDQLRNWLAPYVENT